MALTDRRIRCEISKTVQEQQFEPLKISMSLEGTMLDGANPQEEFNTITDFLEDAVIEQINRMLT